MITLEDQIISLLETIEKHTGKSWIYLGKGNTFKLTGEEQFAGFFANKLDLLRDETWIAELLVKSKFATGTASNLFYFATAGSPIAKLNNCRARAVRPISRKISL